jgi:hypothetical protein
MAEVAAGYAAKECRLICATGCVAGNGVTTETQRSAASLCVLPGSSSRPGRAELQTSSQYPTAIPSFRGSLPAANPAASRTSPGRRRTPLVHRRSLAGSVTISRPASRRAAPDTTTPVVAAVSCRAACTGRPCSTGRTNRGARRSRSTPLGCAMASPPRRSAAMRQSPIRRPSLRRYWPTEPLIERSAASACRRDYPDARSASDTAAVDERVWVIDRTRWRRIPACGELRRAHKLRGPGPRAGRDGGRRGPVAHRARTRAGSPGGGPDAVLLTSTGCRRGTP